MFRNTEDGIKGEVISTTKTISDKDSITSITTKTSYYKDSITSIMGNSNVSTLTSNYFETGMDISNQEMAANFDPNRRSSLGAESLMEHDLNEEMGNLYDCGDSACSEAYLGLEYAEDIFWLHKYNEQTHHPRFYIEKQPEITEYMRCTLVNWLVKVNHELKFGPETIFIAVNLTDKFLASSPIAQDCLQLLAVCALFVAAKLEESVIHGISALVKLCGSAYKHYHFRRMESLLLSTLRFQLHGPTSWFFVNYLSIKSCTTIPIDRNALSLARYTVETCLSSYKIVQYFPSEQAASALVFSCLVISSPQVVYKETEEKFSKEENIFEALSSLNAFAAGLHGTLREIFSCEELENITICFDGIKDYMKPFLQSSESSSNALNIVLPCLNNNSKFNKEQHDGKVKSKEYCQTYPRCCVYNEDKESFERVPTSELHKSRSKFSPYSLTYEMRPKFSPYGFPSGSKQKSRIDHSCCKNELTRKNNSLFRVSRKTKEKDDREESIFDNEKKFAGNASVSLPSGLNIT
ncbi:UNVERIFIED_CONTAM: hypothetical protein RMT77_012433 [Armadillidium vulgare]